MQRNEKHCGTKGILPQRKTWHFTPQYAAYGVAVGRQKDRIYGFSVCELVQLRTETSRIRRHLRRRTAAEENF